MILEQASSPSDTSSQSGMADNETEAERSQQSELSAPALPALKKKRTRTLTTPHQSAVLHALLAKVFSSPHLLITILIFISVSLPNNRNARGSWTPDWSQRSQSPGM